MIIASVSENKEIEKRIAITLETAKKYITLGFEVILSKNYGSHLGISDKQYAELGVKIEEGDYIWYDRHAGNNLEIDNTIFKVIEERDVIIVL